MLTGGATVRGGIRTVGTSKAEARLFFFVVVWLLLVGSVRVGVGC